MTRTIRKMGAAALLTLAVLGATTAGAASAHEWVRNGEPVRSGEPREEREVAWTSRMIFIEKIPGYGFDEFLCEIHEEGLVESGGLAEITKVTNPSGGKLISCTVVRGGEIHASSVSLEAEDLPWKITLATYRSSEVQELFEESAKWLVTTQTSRFGKISSICGVTPSAVLQNKTSWVNANFFEEEASSCLVPALVGKSTLYTYGTNEIRLTSGGSLKVI